ncbi:MAG: MBL fold metallo-hydrolase [Bacteroidales bacterium]|jgi:glyoxylase-like metal-dependent hydrolase (beta-lactamase superfamily II)
MIQHFTFNHFEVNCSVIFDQTKECVLVDVCCQRDRERQKLLDFITENELKVKHILLTHAHIDHVCGAGWATKEFNLPLEMHKDGNKLMRIIDAQAEMMGFNIEGLNDISIKYISKEDIIKYGNSELIIFETPGHCAGSLCFYNKKENFVITGDVLFANSIGRTDLPTGNFDDLMKSIKENLFTLPNNTNCICGHGPTTTIGYEKENNPFIN